MNSQGKPMLGWALYTIANPTQLGQQAVDAWILRVVADERPG